jgi:RimJ/RimL family protein N-acetyltransferase
MDAEPVPLEEPPLREILTDRLRLRTLRPSDAPNLLHILSREEVMRWTVSVCFIVQNEIQLNIAESRMHNRHRQGRAMDQG